MSGEPRTDLDPSLLISSLARDLPRLHQDNTFKDPWEEEEEETSRSSNEEIHALVDELVDSVLAEDEERLSRLGPTPPSFSPADLQARLKELTDRTLKRFPLADPTNRQLNLKRTCQLAISSRLWKAFRDRWKGMPEKENTCTWVASGGVSFEERFSCTEYSLEWILYETLRKKDPYFVIQTQSGKPNLSPFHPLRSQIPLHRQRVTQLIGISFRLLRLDQALDSSYPPRFDSALLFR